MDREERENRRRRAIRPLLILAAALLALIVILIAASGKSGRRAPEAETEEPSSVASSSSWEDPRGEEFWAGAPEIDAQLLTPNPYSRPQIALDEITGIVIHYTANPGSTAQENRDYFEHLGETGDTYVSSHFIVGLDGEIIQCVPSSEIAYASNDANDYTLSIECCHPDWTGEFTEATYDSLVELTGWLCHAFHVDPENVIRHYDVTGKDCPRYYVEHEDAWEAFRADVAKKAEQL